MTKQLFRSFLLAAALAASPSLFAVDYDSLLWFVPYEFALIGDQPYSPTAGVAPTKTQVYPSPEYNNLIAHINQDRVAFTVHIGDIKAGDTLCNDDVYTNNLALFNTFRSPVVYLPGDNEWTDCHRANNGGKDPIERLAFLRKTFYTSNRSLGLITMPLTRQSDVDSNIYRENVIWRKGAVLFVGLNMPGSNNNRNRTTGLFLDPTDAEHTPRNTANLAWIDRAFKMAQADPTIKGVMIFAQANPFERFLEVQTPAYTLSGYADFIGTLRARTIALNRPVVYAHGDTHYWRLDKPLTDTYPACTGGSVPCVPVATGGARIENFTRSEVFAQVDVHWTKVRVEPWNPNVFVFEQRIVPANVKPH